MDSVASRFDAWKISIHARVPNKAGSGSLPIAQLCRSGDTCVLSDGHPRLPRHGVVPFRMGLNTPLVCLSLFNILVCCQPF